MAEDANANIRIDIDTSEATAALRSLQGQIARFHTEMARGGAVANQNAAKLQQNLINSINAGGKFQAGMTKVQSTTEAFTTALEKNKLSMGQYFRYAGASTKTFGRMFSSEFQTITKVATERVKDLQTQYVSMGRDANGALRAIKVRPLTLDMNSLATQTMITAQKQQLYNQLLKQGSTNLLNFGKNTQWAGRQLMVGFTLPLTLFASSAAKSFMEIEKQVIRIRRVYGDFNTTVKETDDMISSIKTLAGEYTKYGVAVSDTIGLASEAAAAGKTGQELLAQVSEATRLAVLGNVEQSQALETTMSVTNAFGVATEDLANKIDFLNAVENQSVTSIEDLTIAIPKAGPVVKQLGGNVEDLAFFLTAMKEGGINASEGANALKSGLAALINPTGKAKEMLQGFGINIEKIVESNKGDVKGLVIDFASALDTLDPLNRARAIEQLFGKFQFSRLSTLFQNVIGEGTQASRVLELTKATTQELAILSQRELKRVEDTTTYKFEKAFADFQAALAPVGEQFLKAVTPVIEFGTKLLNQFNSMGDGAKSFAVILTTVVAGIGPVLLMTVGLVANGVANLIKMFQMLGTIFRKSGADTTTLGLQTEYMTQQQLEAAAVAASLNQSHSKLTQTFSVEAAALNSLTAAYQKAVTAQRGFAMPGGRVSGASTKPKKFASGVVSVPGPKGAGDIVPAMLSPGEAVIPAAMAKKYGGLINGMVSDSIPGYSRGKGSDSNFGHFGPGSSISVQDALSSSDIRLTQAMRRNLEQVVSISKTAVMDLKHAWGAEMSGKTNRQLPSGANIADVQKEFSGKNITERYGESAKFAGFDINDSGLQKEIKAYDTAMQQKIADLRKTGVKAIYDTEEQVRALPENQRKFARSLEALDKEVAAEVGKTNKKFAAMRTSALGQIRDIRFSGAGMTAAEKQQLLNSGSPVTRQRDSKSKKKRIYYSKPASPGRSFGAMPAGQSAATGTQAVKNNNLSISEARKVEVRTDKNGNQRYYLNGQQISAKAGQDAVAKVENANNRNAQARTARANRSEPSAAQPAPKKPSIGSRIASGVKGMGGMGLGMGISMAGGAVSMIPGLQGLGTALAMIGPLFMMMNPAAAGVVAALGLLAFGVYSLIQAQEEQKKKAIELANSMSMTTDKLQGIAELTGEVSATELRRANQEALIAGPQSERSQAFGESFLESDPGKGIIADIANQKAAGISSGNIASNIGAQLATAVAQGVLTTAQAKSIAINLGTELKDYKIATNIEATLTRILGPNGENLATDPLQVTMAITAETNKQAEAAGAAAASGQVNPITDSGVQQGAIGAGIAGTAGAMIATAGAASAGVALFSAAGAAAITTGWTGVGLIAAGALAVAGIAASVISWNEVQTKNVKLTAAAAQNYANAYSQGIGMLDVINQQYDQKVAEQEANLELANTDRERRDIQQEITTLESDRTFALQTQRDANRSLIDDLIKYKDVMDEGTFNSALMGNIENLYKDDAAGLAVAKSGMESINALETDTAGQKTFQATLQLQLASGELDPYTAQTILSAAASNESFSTNYNALIAATGDAQSIMLLQMLGTLEANDQTINTVLATVTQNPEQLDSYIQAMSTLRGIEANGGIAIDINTASGQQQLTDTADLIDQLSKEDKITIDVVQRVTGSKAIATALKANKDFMKLPKSKKIAYAATYTATMNLEGDPAMQTAYENWISTRAAGADASFAAFARYLAGLSASATADTPDTSGGDSGGDSGGGSSSSGTGEKEDKKLARLNKRLDKRQKALNVIKLKEDAINKVYEKRRKALEEIARINSQISNQQRAQLDVASALASGDIAAAARAIQAERARAADFAQEQQMKALEDKRQQEVDGIVVNGKTKEAYEAEIARLNLKIAKRELSLALKEKSGGEGSGGSGSGGGSGSVVDDKKSPKPPKPPKEPAGPTAASTSAEFAKSGKTTSAYMNVVDAGTVSLLQQYKDRLKALPKEAFEARQAIEKKISEMEAGLVAKRVRSLTILDKKETDNAIRQVANEKKIREQQKQSQDAYKTTKLKLSGYLSAIDSGAKAAKSYAKEVAKSAVAKGTMSINAYERMGFAAGGMVRGYSVGGKVMSYFADGGSPLGSDTIPAMLTPGEFVVKRPAVQNFGVKNLEAINNGTSSDGSVYTYNVSVNVATNSDADAIARTVITKIKSIDKQRLGGNNY